MTEIKQQNLSINTSLVCNSSTKHNEVLLESLTVAVRKWLDASYTRVVERKGEMQKTRPSSSTDDLIASSRTLVNQDVQQKINVKLKNRLTHA